MNYQSIVNNDLVTLQNCEDEPIHIPGSIQPHGFLIAVDNEKERVRFCSGNVPRFLGLTHEQVLARSFQQIFTAEQHEVLVTYLNASNQVFTAPLLIKLGEHTFTCLIHKSGELHVLEFEPVTKQVIALSDIYQQTRQFTHFMGSAGTLQNLAQLVAEEVQKFTGFDRVMVYKFDGEHNGHVIAESRIDTIEPFLDLHYPASDIPAQARSLYLKNLLRFIVDVNYNPVPIFTAADNPDKNLDLTHSVLRSVSPIHIQYLKNMGVQASMSVSLVHEQRLWGLIACHHHSAKFISSDLRIAVQLQGHFFTSQITMRERAEEYQIALGIEKALNEMLDMLTDTDNLVFSELVADQKLLDITNSTGVIFCVDNTLYYNGTLPSEDELKKLINWLTVFSPSAPYAVSNLKTVYPDSAAYCAQISGLSFHPLGSGNGKLYCLVPH